ncbi:hypothetical protein THASP1DRAFT_31323 [Thamnocephalis sphaerospora]|uniref:Uncharacterized protein n=1 Tax=Thamnocephalis sphaerospora TaxID=78915 RepID=A0A4V1IWA3_9FUNG|nr:hypothetical protein THASP1DRAFT_31323 [Thamnocephalis sphaerospora]|eukprot:RKP06859.1 hypothetical protein THASP1DRAFT_31323 [Thamnocephalis sphaerospora]
MARKLEISPLLAMEQLLMAEALGYVCRDETAQALRFFSNAFSECDWHFERECYEIVTIYT